MKRLLLQVLLTCSMVLLLASAAMAMTAAGTSISNSATVTYQDVNTVQQSPVTSNAVIVYVIPIWGVTVSPTSQTGPNVTTNGTADQTEVYTLTVQNTGNANDTYNLGSSNSLGNSSLWPQNPTVTFYSTYSGGVLSNSINTIAINMNSTATIYMAVVVPKGTLDTASVVTTATAAGYGSMTVGTNQYTDSGVLATGGSNASGAYTTNITGTPLIPGSGPDAAAKTNSPTSPTAGNIFTYTITMKNDGTANTANLTVTDTLPAGVSYPQDGSITLTNNGGNVQQTDSADYSAGKITVNIGVLAPGAAATISFHATATPAGSYTNTANITYTGGTPVNPQDITTVQAAPVLGLVKKVNNGTGPAYVAPGVPVTYDITANNSGGTNANNVIISDDIPANMSLVSTSTIKTGVDTNHLTNANYTYAPPPAGANGNGTVSTTATTIAPSGTWVLEFQVKVQ